MSPLGWFVVVVVVIIAIIGFVFGPSDFDPPDEDDWGDHE